MVAEGRNNFKSIVECGKSRERRRIILRFLVSTGLIKRTSAVLVGRMYSIEKWEVK